MPRLTRVSMPLLFWLGISCATLGANDRVAEALKPLSNSRGVVAVLGLPEGGADFVVELASARELIVYFQSESPEHVASVRRKADEVGLLGHQIFVDRGSLKSVHLSHNLADLVLVADTVADQITRAEVLRVLHPKATAVIRGERIVKPVPRGYDDWSHPYHGPDNNPQSQDQFVRGSFQTQFIAEPKFSPMPEQSVVAGGRIFKAMGHISHKANQNEMLNTLLCINAYNGMVLWTRPLSEGFMIHRNTMVATEDALFLGDHESCKVIDAITGELRREITVPKELTDGPCWKWMAIEGDVLFALVGNPEIKVETIRSNRPGLGHWPWGMWKGHDYNDPRTAFGHGRNLLAIDRHTGEILWNYRDDDFLDARAICMKNERIYCFCPVNFLTCIDARNGHVIWRNSDKELLEAIGSNERAQHYITGYATTCYMKCSRDHIFFAGPQRSQMVVASTKDGTLQWTNEVGNLQLVLREDAVYAAGPQKTSGMRLDYETGTVIESFPARRACTRATGCVDSIFFRATGGTVRLMTKNNQAQHIAPMRPPCQDGVLVSNGHLYWGPWMCGCQLSLYGNIGLRPVPEQSDQESDAIRVAEALVSYPDAERVEPLHASSRDWPTYRGDARRQDIAKVSLPRQIEHDWSATVSTNALPTAPVAAGRHVFVADRTGVIHAYGSDGKQRWKAYVGGPVYYPPTIADDRLFVSSADGRVYAFEATTGRKLWTYRVAPENRWIHVFGQLVSRWPVAGGVAVRDNTVYAAAGITHYDGTYIVALDASTGQVKARNDTSGVLSDEVQSGISMQGSLSIVDGELRFLGGGVYETARFDLNTLECLNEPSHIPTSQFRTAFYPWYPEYGKYVSLEYTCGDGNVLCHDASYEGSLFGNLALETPQPPGTEGVIKKDAARDFLRRRGKAPQQTRIWRDNENRRFTSFCVSEELLIAAGHLDSSPDQPFLIAIKVSDGSTVWEYALPAQAVKAGIALNAEGQLFVSLENGQLLSLRE